MNKLKKAKDLMGWKPPFHYHYRMIQNGVDLPYDHDLGPFYTINCSPSDCEALGCPRTKSGFKETGEDDDNG